MRLLTLDYNTGLESYKEIYGPGNWFDDATVNDWFKKEYPFVSLPDSPYPYAANAPYISKILLYYCAVNNIDFFYGLSVFLSWLTGSYRWQGISFPTVTVFQLNRPSYQTDYPDAYFDYWSVLPFLPSFALSIYIRVVAFNYPDLTPLSLSETTFFQTFPDYYPGNNIVRVVGPVYNVAEGPLYPFYGFDAFFSFDPKGYDYRFRDIKISNLPDFVNFYPADDNFNNLHTFNSRTTSDYAEYFEYVLKPFLTDLKNNAAYQEARAIISKIDSDNNLAVAAAESDAAYYLKQAQDETISQLDNAQSVADYNVLLSYTARQQAMIQLSSYEASIG